MGAISGKNIKEVLIMPKFSLAKYLAREHGISVSEAEKILKERRKLSYDNYNILDLTGIKKNKKEKKNEDH